MISVLNRHQPLSGNKIIFLVLFFIFSSCGLLKGTTVPEGKEKVEKEIENKKPERNVAKEEAPKPVEGEKPSNKQVVWFDGEKFEVESSKKTEFKIALILPFNLNKSSAVDLRLRDIMFEYYHGWQTALKELEQAGFKSKIYVYDSENDSNTLAKILNLHVLKNVDVIVGPISDVQMKMVSKFGLANNIPVFSPFTPVDQLVNPNFYNFSIDHKSKAIQIVKYLKKYHPKDKFFVVRDGKKYDQEFVPFLIEELKKENYPYTSVPFSNINTWSTSLNAEKHVVYIPTTEKNVVSVSLGNIYATKKKVEVIGEYKWLEFVNNDYKFWSNLDVHLVTSTFINYHDTLAFGFRDNYRVGYKIDPSEYAFTGYAQAKFLGEALSAFGEHFGHFVSNRNLVYCGTSFQFELKQGIKKNQNLWILKFVDGELIPVNY